MKATLWAVSCALCLFSTCICAAPGQEQFTAERHMAKGVQCNQCHVENDTARPVRKQQCLACHGSYEKIAERTKNSVPNPHFSHYGEKDCSTCHKGHAPSEVSCNSCHKFSLKTP